MVKRSKFGDSQLNGELKTQKNHQVRSTTIVILIKKNKKFYVMRWWCFEKEINGINLQLNSLLGIVIMTVLKRMFRETGSWKLFT